MLCFTECSSCWLVLIGIPRTTETARGQEADFLALLNSFLSTPPNIHLHMCTHTGTHTQTLILHILLLFLHDSCAYMILHWLCSCTISLRASAHDFSTQFFNNSGLEEHLQRHLCPCTYLVMILKGAEIRDSIFLCSSSTETKVILPNTWQNIKSRLKSGILWIRWIGDSWSV